ncbi:MAG: hypothetical protein MI974_12115 [Chitinophagales bacterium]|nr:hypothetical protein [Chitinophagales bacterium]
MRDTMLIIHFIGIAMFIGTGFAFMFLEIANSKTKEKEEALRFTLKTFALSKMGHIGLALLLLSGFYLMNPYWSNLTYIPLLLAKLILVAVLAIVIGIIASLAKKAEKAKKAKKGNAEMHLKKLEIFSKISFILGIAIVILAVLAFH